MAVTLKKKDKDIILNSKQEELYSILKKISSNSFVKSNKKFSLVDFLLRRKEKDSNILGLYIHGRPGRGKSMLVKNFYNNLKTQDNLYFHFNSFMSLVHEEMHKARQVKSKGKTKLIEEITEKIVKNSKVICIDEFQVDDVADAMILKNIFSYIFSKRIIVVFTSNLKPENLYQEGLQRDLFLEFIDNIIYKKCKIFDLNSKIDYRSKFLNKIQDHYLYPINKNNQDKFFKIIKNLTEEKETYVEKIKILGRDLVINKAYKNIVIFSFKDLFESNLGALDYKIICQKYDIILVNNLPKLKAEDRNEVKRFILFIDEIYENSNILLILSQESMEQIYVDGKYKEKFQRTISRLKEIMSEDYIKNTVKLSLFIAIVSLFYFYPNNVYAQIGSNKIAKEQSKSIDLPYGNKNYQVKNPRIAMFWPKEVTPNRLFPANLSKPIKFNSSNNLIKKSGSFYQATGEVILIKGKVTDPFGIPISGVIIEIWQTNSAGKYQNLLEKNSNLIDSHFNMSGKAITDNLGNYHFLTIMPGFYLNRAPHININIYHKDFDKIETEMYFKDHPSNLEDYEYLLYSDQDKKLLTSNVRLSNIFYKNSEKICIFNIVMNGVHKYKNYGGNN